ncbi:MAG: DUF5752 family protein [Candidatus Bathyarchaeia archaeon]
MAVSLSSSRILRKLPREKAFYFFTSIGNYTGENASSLEAFLDKIEEVDVKSLEFHLYRGDFERWIAGTLGDEELAGKIQDLRAMKQVGDVLRDQLCFIVSKHFNKLKESST